MSKALRSGWPGLGAGREHITDWLRQVPVNRLKGQFAKTVGVNRAWTQRQTPRAAG